MKFAKRLCALLLMLTLMLSAFPFGALNTYAMSGAGAPTDLNYYALGIDVSAWQAGGGNNPGLVNFTALKNSGCKFVILRIGYGQSLDKAFVSFYNNARAAGMPLGLYMYGLKTSYSGAVSDANWVISVIEQYNMYFEYPIYYDLEEQSQVNLSSSAKNSLCLGWCETLEAAGYFPGIYAGKSQICDHLTSSFKAKYDLWVPHVLSGAGSEWSSQFNHKSKNYNAQGFGMWQYSWSNIYNGSYVYDGVYKSGTKKVDALDLDVCYKDYPTIMKTYGYNNCGSDEKMLLKEVIDKVQHVRYDQYSATGVNALRTAFENAVSVYNNESSTSDACKNARAALENALKGTDTSVVSSNKNYTVKNTSNTGDYADDGKKLTDGVKGTLDGGTNKFVGFKDAEIVVDLGSVQSANIFKMYMTGGDWGIEIPTAEQLVMNISVSTDGTNYTPVTTNNTYVKSGVKTNNWEALTMTAASASAVSARYVKFNINSSAPNNYVWLDEVEVINGEPLLSGNVYVNGMNQKIGSGDCFVFTPEFGAITVENANHAWTVNVVAKWVEGNKYEVVSKTNGEGPTTPSVTLNDGEILIACHNWEKGVTDGSAVIGSAANADMLYSLNAGDTIYLEGIDSYTSSMTAVPYIVIDAKEDVVPTPPEVHEHVPGETTCERGQVCATCGEVIVPAEGHDDGEWVLVEEGLEELQCTKCGTMLDSRVVENSEEESDNPVVGDDSSDVVEESSDVVEESSDVIEESSEDVSSEDTSSEDTSSEDTSSDDKNEDEDEDEDELVGLRGDINDNGKIDMTDYILLKRFYFGTYELNEDQILRCDIDDDGFFGMIDYILLKRAYFGTYTIQNPYVYRVK